MHWLKRLLGLFGGEASASNVSETEKADRASIIARFAALAQPAVLLAPHGAAGFSRLGGLPQMPADTAWPQYGGKPQAFLAQLDLAEVHSAMASSLPATGFLFFFYDQEQGVWGFDPKDAEGWQVVHTQADCRSLPERSAPEGLPEEFIYQRKPVQAERIELLPDTPRLPRAEFDWKRDGDAYTNYRQEVFGERTRHQVLGFPTPVQGDDMELECQLASNGIYVGGPEGYENPRVEELRAGASEWKLLLQLDTDDDTGWMWGDVGTLYFWMRESDMKAGDFSRAWMVFQCC
ncbi:MAG: YwqG family protein [Verrucomicrobia bacterium]|nr:YwqG family protein [Verrucomicrobiota bacterium]